MRKRHESSIGRSLLRPASAAVPAAFVLVLTFSTGAQAYVGPGAGLSLLGALWALLAAVGAAFGFLVTWPVRRYLRRRRARVASAAAVAAAPPEPAPEAPAPEAPAPQEEAAPERRRRVG